MNRLYVFAIGGSGERVMESLVMMLAAGMPIGAQSIVPVFVDNDITSKAMKDCLEMINYYRGDAPQILGLHELGEMSQNAHNAMPTFAKARIDEPISLSLAGEDLMNLRNIIGVNEQGTTPIEKSILEERDLLFSDDDLDMQLNFGFVGNPNVGSVVLNSTVFQDQNFKQLNIAADDGVFIIGSLFGGTGAAGFPLIANTLKDRPNPPLMGGVAVLPYFCAPQNEQVQNPNGFNGNQRVHSESFDSKTRAALVYYDQYMKHVDYMYYVGNNKEQSIYKYCIGGSGQNNPYNLIEVMAALSVIDFSKQNGRPQNQVFRIPSWDFNNGNKSLSNLSGIPNKELKKAMVKFQMMKVMLENPNFIEQLLKDNTPPVSDIRFDKTMLDAIRNYAQSTDPRVKGLGYFLKKWEQWMDSLANEALTRRLTIFNQSRTKSLTAKEITTEFHTERAPEQQNFGIAKAEERTVSDGFLGLGRKTIIEPQDPDINNVLTAVYNGKRWDHSKFKPSDAIQTLILEISLALDKVIDDKCTF